jgi:glycolate oxidase FAD binding subunit
VSAAATTAAEALEALAREVGVSLELERHEPVSIDGVAVSMTLRPRDGDALARSVRALGERALALVPVGGGCHLGLGNLPRRIDALLSTAHLAGVDVFEPGEGVCHAGAGTRLGALRATAAAAGWEVPIDAPDEASLGGAIAVAAVGPRSQAFGAPRDVVLGLEVVLGSGERTRCGGRVVKNVTGYDLPKLYTGSHGALGVIEGAWLRLRPRPVCTRVLALPARAPADAIARGVATARLHSARACALEGRAGGPLRGLLELGGAEEEVLHDARRLAREQGAMPAEDALLDALRARQHALPSPRGLRFRIPALPTQQAGVLAALDPQAQVIVYPGLRLCYAAFELVSVDDVAAASRAFASAEAGARAAEGAFRCESAPPAAKRGRDVFGPLGQEAPLIHALKARFDPHGVLAPGRFAGGA